MVGYRWLTGGLAGAMVLAIAGTLSAEAPAASETDSLKAEVQALRTEMAQIKQTQSDNWLNERRAEEIKGLIHEVLADAETRATLLQDSLQAGHDGNNFFLRSGDDAFLMNVGGQIQFRWVGDSQDDRDDEHDSGFQLARTKLLFEGHVGEPVIEYKVQLATDRDDGRVFAEEVIVAHDLSDALTIRGGRMKLPMLREELVSSRRQLAVERSIVNEFFTLNRAEQVQLAYKADTFQIVGAVSDGANSGHSDFASDTSEVAFTGRADVLISGDWNQGKDFTSWAGDEQMILVGGAVHYETGDANNGGMADYLGWTLDGSFESNGVNVFAAVNGATIEPDAGGDRDPIGIVVQGGYNIDDTIEPFVRWETLDWDDAAGTDELQAFTLGANYYLRGHDSKFTVDVLWIYDGASGSSNPFGASATSEGLGISSFSAADDEDLMALRAQFQLLF